MAVRLSADFDLSELEKLLAEVNHGGREVPRSRQVFANRNLRMELIQACGFDMDYTLAIYHKRQIEELSFQMTLQRLIHERGYPQSVASITYDPDFVIRGLMIDKLHGNIFKMDRHGHVGRCYHGRRLLSKGERRALYRHEKIRPATPRYAWIDTLFALPEACLFAEIIQKLEGEAPVQAEERGSLATGGGRKAGAWYEKLFVDIRECIDTVHRDGSLKAVIKKDLGRFIFRDPELGPALHKLRSGGKKLFLLTNSFWDYTDAVMRFLLDGVLPEYPSWRNYFDTVIVGAQKPAWFVESAPFLELSATGEVVGEARALERGKVYQGGNLADFERLVNYGGESVLYVGDHIYGDIIKNKKHTLWRTAMVVQELEEETEYLERQEPVLKNIRELERIRRRLDDALNRHKLLLNEIDRDLERAEGGARAALEEARRREKTDLERLRRALKEVIQRIDALEAQVEDGFNPSWGLVFKEGNENSRFGEQVEDYACIYTSRVSNFLYYSPMQYFRSPRDQMPHEREA